VNVPKIIYEEARNKMKKIFSALCAFVLFSMLILPKYVSAATLQTNVEFNATATVRYSDWLDGSNSTLDIHVSDLPENVEFSNGVYSGWCIQPRMTGLLHGESAVIYSSLSSALPSDLASLPWHKINYVLNHKVRGEGKSDLEFFKDVQTAIWLLVGDDNPEFGISPEAQKMVDDANANSGYMPGDGDIVAFIVYSDGISLTKDDFVQEVIIEVVLHLLPTETPTPTATLTITPTSTTSTPTETVTTTPSPTETVTMTPSPTETVPPTSTSPTPTETLTITSTSTFTPTVTPTSTFTPTPTLTGTPVCVPTVVRADFSRVAAGQSVEGWDVVAPGLNIDAKGTAVSLRAGLDPRAYGAPNDAPGGNAGLSASGGFSDIPTQSALQAHLYTFTFAPGTSVNNFTLHMLDYGDWNVVSSTSHYVSLTAYNVNGVVVAKQELSFTTPAVGLPRSSDKYGDLWFTGDAVTALPGQPGNWTWNVSGNGIVRVVLEFGVGHDPNVAFDTLTFTTECP
jgi:hypothetical protein